MERGREERGTKNGVGEGWTGGRRKGRAKEEREDRRTREEGQDKKQALETIGPSLQKAIKWGCSVIYQSD